MDPKKTVVFCGASSGLGKVAAIKFLQSHWDVVNLDIAPNPDLDALGVQFYLCDLTSFSETRSVFQKILEKSELVSALINCIRYRNKNHNTDKNPANYWKKSCEIGLDTYYNASFIVSEHMKTKKSECSIISLSSITSSLITLNEEISYHVAKAGINQMMRYLAVQYGPYGIRANAVLPGLISKEKSEKSSNQPNASRYAKIAQLIPLQRSGAPEEVAELLLFLASPKSSFITGQTICIDGGLSARDQVDCILHEKTLL